MTTHLVLGTGSVGAPLIRELTSRGHRVIAVNRSGSRAGLPGETELRVGDLADPGFARDALADADVAYQVTMPPYHRWADDFPSLASGVLDAAARTQTRLVIGDNLYCYGPPAGALSERSPETATTVKGRVRKAIADEALAAHRAGRVEVALARPSNFFGADYGLTRRLLLAPALAGRRLSVLGRLDRPHAFAYLPDAARAMADIGGADDASGRAWVLPAMAPTTQRELCDAIWHAAGRQGPAKVSALRGAAMRLVGAFDPAVRASVEMAYEFDEPFVVDASEFESRFGWTATPVAEAVSAALQEATRADSLAN